MTPLPFRESPAKRVVREQWNTPFLRHIHEAYNVRYRYMGLPGPDLIDIKLWRDMIDEVIAFEVRAPRPDERRWIRQLRVNLKKLEIPGTAYLGSFEEVVIRRKDNEGQNYRQDKVITLYNLDFCDEIASKVDTLEWGRQQWRFEALRVILEDQKQCYRQLEEPSLFIVLLTVRNQIEASKIRAFLRGGLLTETSSYCSACQWIKPLPLAGPLIGSHAWALKAFLYDTLAGYFRAPNICTLFFPIVKYLGTPKKIGGGKTIRSPMLHWMLFCQFGHPQDPAPKHQPSSFLEQATSLAVEGTGVGFAPEPGEAICIGNAPSAVDWFKRFEHSFLGTGTASPS